MKTSFFEDNGGYLYNIKLEWTVDPHSRKVIVDGKYVGDLMFHDWKFALYPGPYTTLPLRLMPQIMNEIDCDTSIWSQWDTDHPKSE